MNSISFENATLLNLLRESFVTIVMAGIMN